MSLPRRIAALFVAPAGRDAQEPGTDGPRSPHAPPAAPTHTPRLGERLAPNVAVLAPAADAPALGAALGLALARASRAGVCVVCVWAPGPVRSTWRAPAMPAAARLASSLSARGHDASATGRLVVVRLSAVGAEAASQALRVSAAAGAAPTVVALAGPRAAAFDALLAMQDLVVVAVAPAADAALTHLATVGLPRALTCRFAPAASGRALAAAGLALLPSIRRALAAPVSALS